MVTTSCYSIPVYATFANQSDNFAVGSSSVIGCAVIEPCGPLYDRPSYHFGPPTALFSEARIFQASCLIRDLGLGDFTLDAILIDLAFDLTIGAAGSSGEGKKSPPLGIGGGSHRMAHYKMDKPDQTGFCSRGSSSSYSSRQVDR